VDCAVQLNGRLLIGRSTGHNFCWIIASQPLTSTCVRSIAQSPLLRLHFCVQRVGCTAGKCNFNEVGNSPAMRCGGDAMRRQCDAAMRRRCNSDATAMRPRRCQMAMRRNRRESGAETGANPAQKPAQYVKVFP
jgi:hypothetical protein